MNISWEKVACVAFCLLTSIAGWGLKKVYDVDIKVTRLEAKMEIWHTPIPEPRHETPVLFHLASMPQLRAQDVEFIQKVMIRATDQILLEQHDEAIKTLLIGLEQSGLRCEIEDKHLVCE